MGTRSPRPKRTLFVTGADTGVGKTVLTVGLARDLQRRGVGVAALKPFCSGGRDDARALQVAAASGLDLDEINPWFFRAPLTPLVAARQEGREIRMDAVLNHVRRIRRRFEVTLIEGAGGLLSPLGEGFDARDLIDALDATPILVCPDRLGVLNQALLAHGALPRRLAARMQVVLAQQPAPDVSARTNRACLEERIGRGRVHRIPWVGEGGGLVSGTPGQLLRRALGGLLGALNLGGNRRLFMNHEVSRPKRR